MSREDSADTPRSSLASPLLSPTIATPKWRRVAPHSAADDGLDTFVLDKASADVEEDLEDDAILRRHEEFAMEERKRWLPTEDESKSKSPTPKKRHKMRGSLPIFPTPYECNQIVLKSTSNEGSTKKAAGASENATYANGYGTDSANALHGSSDLSNGHASPSNGSKANGSNEQCLVITMESFKRLQDVLCRERDYFNRVLSGLEKCIKEKEPSIAIHTDVDRKVVFSEDEFKHLIHSVKYSFESIDSLQTMLKERSEGLKKQFKKAVKADRSVSSKNGKSKTKSNHKQKAGRELVPPEYSLTGLP
mmetsp:Transcript_6336/g.19137  ORF Transcript_6336/g.19137 Transcript_6336/m.19137 type:complete len:306 (+) Transcript_6336:307-1224(+)